MVYQAFNPSTWDQRQVDLCELQCRQGYIIEKPCLKNKQEQSAACILLKFSVIGDAAPW